MCSKKVPIAINALDGFRMRRWRILCTVEHSRQCKRRASAFVLNMRKLKCIGRQVLGHWLHCCCCCWRSPLMNRMFLCARVYRSYCALHAIIHIHIHIDKIFHPSRDMQKMAFMYEFSWCCLRGYVCVYACSFHRFIYICAVFLREMFGVRMDVENMFLWRQFKQKCLDIRR